MDAIKNFSISTNLEEWGLPEAVLNHYKKRKITCMFPWQAECLSMGSVLDGENLIYSAPTSAGKTLVAEILVAQTVFEKQKKALIILPFVSVVREKMFYFQEMFSETGIRVEGFMGGHTPKASFQQVHVGVCTIEKANSLINRMLEEKTLSTLGIVVVDELHLLGDPYRGYLLELLLTKLKYMSAKNDDIQLQIVGMSATLPNLNALAKWLKARLFFTEFRPVPLAEHMKCGKTILNKLLEPIGEVIDHPGDDSEQMGQLCIETLSNNHSALIFCPTKAWCESLAVKLAMYFQKLGCGAEAVIEGTPGWVLRKQLDLNKLRSVVDHLKVSPVGLDKDLVKTIPMGVAFHHAGLTLDERDIIEGSFRNGSIRILCATSTLSSGVNLPARRVIIRSPMSFGGVMDVMTYRQMIGRAGRMGVDTHGESILICKPNEKRICQELMNSGLKPIVSCLGSGHLSASLKRALLEVIASRIATTAEQLSEYAAATFLATTNKGKLEDPLTSCVDFLIENDLIRLKDGEDSYAPTPLGEACLASSLPPDEGLALFRELERARRCFVLDSDLHIVYQVTPYTVSEQWGKIDWLKVLSMLEELSPSMRRVADLVGIEDAFLVKVVKGVVNANNQVHRNKLSIHRRFYTALALHDLVNEVPLSEVAQKYDCNKGMMQQLQQNAATYAGMVAEFAKRLRWGTVELIVGQFQERLQFGVQSELCELMKLPSINGLRARALYNAGITTLSEVANSEVSSVEAALLNATPFQSKGQGAGETTYEAEQRAKMQQVWVTGRAGLSIQSAAEILIKEAREVLEVELGVSAQWGSKGGSKTLLETSAVSHISQRPRIVSPAKNSPPRSSQDSGLYKSPKSDKCDIMEGENFNDLTTSRSILTKNEISVPESPEIKSIEENARSVNISSCRKKLDLCEKEHEQESSKKAVDSVIEADLGMIPFDTVCNWEESVREPQAASAQFNKIVGETQQHEKSQDSFSGSFILELPKILNKNVTKMSQKNRYSADMFDASCRQPCSTPLQGFKPQQLQSPDLFNQSLTFDTQLERIIDSEEMPTYSEDVPYSPPRSDDLGYLSDTPVIIAEISTDAIVGMETVGESYFAIASGVARKRKASPDLIQGSDDSLTEDFKRSRRTRNVGLFRTRSKKELKRPQEDRLGSSDDEEIASTPIEQRTPSKTTSALSCINVPKRRKCDIEVVDLGSEDSAMKRIDTKESPAKKLVYPEPDLDLDGIEWDTLNLVDVCGNQEVFTSFQEELQQQKIVSVALGYRKKLEAPKPKIGAKFRKTEHTSKVILEDSYFSFEDKVLDGLAVYWHRNNVFYVNCCKSIVAKENLLVLISNLFSSKTILRIFDAREQLRLLTLCTNLLVECPIEDPKVASWLLSTTGAESDFRSIQREFLPEAESCLSVMGRIREGPASLDVESNVTAIIRACSESIIVYHIIPRQLEKLVDVGLLKVFKDVEMPTIRILAEMETEGMTINDAKLKSIKAELEGLAENLESQAHLLAGRKFPLSSHAAVGKMLFSELRLGKASITTKRNAPSTSKEALELLESESKHPLPRIILQWRKIQAIINKTLCPLLQLLPETKVRGICQTFTVTGRISMREPNVQNIPKDFEVAVEKDKRVSVCLRDLFVAEPGYCLLTADYCQIELRMLAHLAQDETLIANIVASEDIFISIASSLLNKQDNQITQDDRQRAKQVCYGIIYGIGPRSLAKQLEITEDVALALMTDFKSTYKGVGNFLSETVNSCRARGFVDTLSGRRRYLSAINSDVPAARAEAERQAVNTCVQGSAADLVKRAMIAIRATTKDRAKLILHLHDELMYQVKMEDADWAAHQIKHCMENAIKLRIATPVKVKTGPTWGQLWPHQTNNTKPNSLPKHGVF